MRAFKCDDLYRHRALSGLDGSTHHPRVVFHRSKPSRKSGSYVSTLWCLDTSAHDARVRQLTAATSSASSACIATSDQRVAFLSQREDDSDKQVYVIPIDGGEARRVTRDAKGLSSLLQWSHEGSRLLALQDCPWAEDDHDDTKAKSRPLVVRSLPWKHDGSSVGAGFRTRLVEIDAASGDVRTLACGDFNVADAAWSPDGATLVYARTPSGTQRHASELWQEAGDGGDARCIDTFQSLSGMTFSPDGGTLAFSGSRVEGESLSDLWLCDMASGECRTPATEPLHLEGGSIAWHPDGTRVAVVHMHRALTSIGVLAIDSGQTTTLPLGLRQVTGLAAVGDTLVCIAESMRRCNEVYTVNWDGSQVRRRSGFNTWFRKLTSPRVSIRTFELPDGKGGSERVDAWLLRPAEGDGPFPLLVDFHGGPQSVALVDHPNHFFRHALLAEGWAVLMPNLVGSAGYGDEFANRLVGHWGDYELPQVEAILEALRADGVIDTRVACFGKSYGGYLSAWAAWTTDLFKAAVINAPVANLQSHGGTSDTGYYVTPYATGHELHKACETFQDASPVAHPPHRTAATLLLQGQDDQRCPLGQSEELFAALVRAGRTDDVKMVVYPGAKHTFPGSGQLSQRVDYHQRVVDWVSRHA